MKYTIELDEAQVRLIREACEFMSRFTCGQIDTSYWPQSTLYGKAQQEWTPDEWNDRRDQLDLLMKQVQKVGWNGQSYSLHYSVVSDSLWDMHEVIRHQLYLDGLPSKYLYGNDAYPAHHCNRQQPLITITPVKSDE